ncbi:hypothetical protein CC85DRAFT_14450 [Cutaneotrichosporon oleaginosum]|uniref:Uncharacterized protein n=1 Tax=Cutaneotrichosporon oleaginosum TaxID=879819 RepID=A0A0J1ATZ2_9TREE|nr:uncharacterized protein CC85DRAFT_14450 [Cutaneotrichosporon oleaginosum]KLT38779.1 hypothetical protein CC85DRAFT_14450 [Cutaneotrichosporon oleaginosum]TXT09938.1 hypothetical protein COLE_03872 [Cutaneotrichosporon oleaginosum]
MTVTPHSQPRPQAEASGSHYQPSLPPHPGPGSQWVQHGYQAVPRLIPAPQQQWVPQGHQAIPSPHPGRQKRRVQRGHQATSTQNQGHQQQQMQGIPMFYNRGRQQQWPQGHLVMPTPDARARATPGHTRPLNDAAASPTGSARPPSTRPTPIPTFATIPQDARAHSSSSAYAGPSYTAPATPTRSSRAQSTQAAPIPLFTTAPQDTSAHGGSPDHASPPYISPAASTSPTLPELDAWLSLGCNIPGLRIPGMLDDLYATFDQLAPVVDQVLDEGIVQQMDEPAAHEEPGSRQTKRGQEDFTSPTWDADDMFRTLTQTGEDSEFFADPFVLEQTEQIHE